MSYKPIAAGRVFAGYYQIVICDDPTQTLQDTGNWTDQAVTSGYAGTPTFRLVGTEADLNDHWIELALSDNPPNVGEWQRITVVHFQSRSGKIYVMSILDNDPPISANILPGDYTAYIAGQNLGVDVFSLGENGKLSDAELAARKDLEWYRIYVVPGKPVAEGRLIDRL